MKVINHCASKLILHSFMTGAIYYHFMKIALSFLFLLLKKGLAKIFRFIATPPWSKEFFGSQTMFA